jgi:hypothetical protein
MLCEYTFVLMVKVPRALSFRFSFLHAQLLEIIYVLSKYILPGIR